MVKQIELTIPTDWAGVTLRKYLAVRKEMKNYEDDDEANTAVMLWHLCGLDPAYLKSIAMQDYSTIKSELEGFMQNTELPLQRFIQIDGIEYGFEPNLSKMSYGAYIDITQYKEITIDENWAKIMNILYRPVTDKRGEGYSIKAYSGEMDWKKWLDVGMDYHFGTLFFFVNLSIDLGKSTQKYLMETELSPSIKSILERSGEIIQQSMNLRKEISLSTKR